MYTLLLFKVNKFKVNILDETDDISLCCISDVLSIHFQDLVIGKEFLVRRSVCKSSWRAQNQQGASECLFDLGLLHMSPITGLARLPGRILWWVHMGNFSPVDRDEFKKHNQNGGT